MKFRYFGRTALAFVTAATLLASSSARAQTIVTSFSDIQYWVGTGSNEAAMVIDWKDGANSASLVWGFRWNGTASGEDMIKAIAGNLGNFDGTSATPATATGSGDPSLTLYTDTEFSFGDIVYQLSYNSGDSNHSTGGFDVGSPGFWSYYTADGTTTLPASWTSSPVGMSDRTLSNDSWDAWTWAANFTDTPPASPVAAAVPEPAPLAMLIVGGGGLFLLYKRRHA